MNTTCDNSFSSNITYNATCNTLDEFNRTTFDEDEFLENYITIILAYCFFILAASCLTLFTLIYGVLKWIAIPKWRSFRKYVYINVIFCYTMSSWLVYGVFFVENYDAVTALSIVTFYFVNASSCWLLVGSLLIYMDIVIVFKSNITRKCLKSNAFSWGVPLVLALLHLSGELFPELEIFVFLLRDSFAFSGMMMVINLCLYVKVLCCLCKNSGLSGSPRVWQKIKVATITFLLSGAPVLIAALVSLPIPKYSIANLISDALPTLQTVIMSVCFLLTNRNPTCCKRSSNERMRTY